MKNFPGLTTIPSFKYGKDEKCLFTFMTCLQTFSLEERIASAPDAALTDKEP